jgi:hypothetical protein
MIYVATFFGGLLGAAIASCVVQGYQNPNLAKRWFWTHNVEDVLIVFLPAFKVGAWLRRKADSRD